MLVVQIAKRRTVQQPRRCWRRKAQSCSANRALQRASCPQWVPRNTLPARSHVQSCTPTRSSVTLAFFTGMRLDEIAALRWNQVNLDNRTIRGPRQRWRVEHSLVYRNHPALVVLRFASVEAGRLL